MKILFVNNLPLADSESGVYTTNLAKDLTDNGHECAILFPENTVKYKKYGDIKLFPVFFKDEEEIEDQVEFNFPCFSTHPRSHYNFMDMSRKDRNEYLEVFFRSIYKAIYEFEPDIIHGQNLWVLSGISSTISDIHRLPVIVTSHGSDMISINNEHRRNIEWGTVWAHEAYDYASKVIATSEDNLKLLEDEFGQDDKVVLILDDDNVKEVEDIYKKTLGITEKTNKRKQ